MNRKHKTYGHFIAMVVAMIVGAVGISAVYQTARNRPPIAYGNLSPESIAKFNKKMAEAGDQGSLFVLEQLVLSQWDNENDYGAQDTAGWTHIEDDRFIVYYKDDLNNVWKQNAQLTLRLANEAIPQMKAVFGKYTYPEDINGRKLPIYLPPTRSQYGETISILYGGPTDSEGSLGMTIYKVSQSGYLPMGIVLLKDLFDKNADFCNSLVVVLPHELSHYVYASLFQFSDDCVPMNWVKEGIADYVAGRNPQVQGQDSVDFIERYCDLKKDFPVEKGNFSNNQYWAGESFFNFIKEKYGKEKVNEFIQSTYTISIDSALLVTFPNKDMHREWVDGLKTNAPSNQAIALTNE